MPVKSFENVTWKAAAHIILCAFALAAVMPFVLLIAASFTDNNTALAQGFSFLPKKLSLDAYVYIVREWRTIGRAYFMTILVTVSGTAISLIVTCMFAYALSQGNLPGRNLLTFLCVFPMLFNGGLVASYYVWSSVFQIKNTLWALIIPNLLMNTFNVILIKNYFQNSISPSILEAARIDGISEFGLFVRIVMPLSVPLVATIGLMGALAYWNDWTNGLYYLTERDGGQFYTIQLVLNSINENINFLANNSELMSRANIQNLPSTTMRMAIAVIGILPILAAYPFFQQYFVKGITLGGVKE
ncbi:MAG: carbohydrate ABC transporter permease [Clostridiales bacterium]|jgi:putative aldouronate transport system permease protein|nr:carbohydrate ABC transporter permease [Clostridiales bacterium]